MEDPSRFQQMQDEMSRFEAEISGPGGPGLPMSSLAGGRPVIAAKTFGAVQQQLERVPLPPPPPPPPPGLLRPPFDPSMMMPRMMFPGIPPPPPPPSMLIPSQVRMRPAMFSDASSFPGIPLAPPMSRSIPGPAAMPPQKPQPAVLSAAPKLYKQTKQKDQHKEKEKDKEKEEKKKKAEPPPPPPKPQPPPVPIEVPQPAPAVSVVQDTTQTKNKKEKKNRKTIRAAGGTTWEDATLLDWPDDDFRLFAGDLGNDVTDELLVRTFSKYGSFLRAKVIRDKRTNKSKGFGFISFREPQDFIKAMKEMNGRYVGSRPIKLRKSTWRNRSLDVVRKKEKEKAALLALLISGNKS